MPFSRSRAVHVLITVARAPAHHLIARTADAGAIVSIGGRVVVVRSGVSDASINWTHPGSTDPHTRGTIIAGAHVFEADLPASARLIACVRSTTYPIPPTFIVDKTWCRPDARGATS
jgi:hypothetical protein